MEISLRNVTKSFGERVVLDGVNLTFDEGKVNCLLGPSGVGKTTVLNILAGLETCGGSVQKPEKVAYIFQNSRLLPNLTVWENVEYVILDMPADERKRLITSLLETVELYDRRNSLPKELSGGMQRRVAMARAYAYPADLLLMDEPFSALDIALKLRQIEVYNRLAERYPRTTVFVTHDVDEVLLFADSVTVLGKCGKPLDRMEISSPRVNRTLFSEEAARMKERIVSLLTSADGEEKRA